MKTKLMFPLFFSIVLSTSLVFASAAPVLELEVKNKKKTPASTPQSKSTEKTSQPNLKPSVVAQTPTKPSIQKTVPEIKSAEKNISEKKAPAKPKVNKADSKTAVVASVQSTQAPVKVKKSIPKEVKEKATAQPVDPKLEEKKAKAAKRAAEKQAAIDLHNKNAPAYENKDAKLAGAKLTPTVYFLPTFDLDNDKEAQCSERAKKAILGVDGKKQIKVCPDVYDSCLLQGTCHLIEDGQKITIGYSTQKNGKYYFEIEEGESRCPYGVGVRNVCMDPYFTVAADLRYNKLGDVIYVPEVVGTVLPGGYKHNGFFIVRDKGGAIKGAHRYDFYIGESLPGKDTSPFHHLNLQSKKHKKYYYYIKGETADKFRAARNFKFPRPKK